MQDPSLYSQIKAQVQQPPPPQFPEQEHLKCPRCDSSNTKFCYYNNYNLSQPRHFCKNCRRYWTKGGALRNIPVGGGSRKNSKRGASSSSTSATKRPAAASSSSVKSETAEPPPLKGENFAGQFGNLMEPSGSFSSLLGSSGGHFGNFLDGLGTTGPGLRVAGQFGDPGSGQNVDPSVLESDVSVSNNADGFLSIHGGDGGGGGGGGDGGCWDGGGNGWPDLAIYTPGSTFL
ncbi:hypothetical protein SASPL_139457 [Salvia splendens]|uniref:Dof zinc finger protein n=1 Tax=Salvia splendens TaxID=180675 RepID=A0A8X8ZAF4_SALSN|nr:dof zinc finger protein DOF3.1-like [Salvia splendens]KAG6398007.1 hypothetical protein SASPL_139457 [Salvia splendens]